jgi:hypothetical protein
MRFRRIAERRHQRVIPQDLVDPRPLHPNPPSVNEPDLRQANLVRRANVLVDDRRNIARRESVQVDRLFDGYAMHVYYTGATPPGRIVQLRSSSFVEISP